MHYRASTYRLLVSVFVVLVAICCIFPVRDRPFEKYVTSHVTNDKKEFDDLLKVAHERISNGTSKTFYSAIRDVASAKRIDLSNFFRNKNVADIKSIDKKNKILLDALLADSKGKIKQGLDLKGGVSFVLKIDDSNKVDGRRFDQLSAPERNEQLNKAIEIIRQRIDGLGVSEPIIRIFGNNSIEIQLPGISTKDNPEIVDVIKKPAKLEFRLLSNTAIPKSRGAEPPIGYEILSLESDRDDDSAGEHLFFVKKIPEMTGKMVAHAGVAVGQYGEFGVSLSMTEDGAKRFEKVTSENIGRQLGIVLDGKLCSAPVINSAISGGHASITGKFSQREALELANVLNNPLEVELKFVELNEIGPSLAEDAKISSLKASIIAACAIVIFMVAYYHIAGVISVLSIAANIAIVLGMMAIIGATLTLPGVAALVLTIGMAIDANILVFERVRDELRDGKSVGAALLAGHKKAFWTILDANLTTLLAAIVLIYFGTGPIKGFGVILAIGLFSTVFCALVLNRGLLEVFGENRFIRKLIPDFSIKSPKFDFLGHSKFVCAVYGVLFLIGAIAVVAKETKIYGIDFTGGDEITVKFEKKVQTNDISKLAELNGIGEVTSVYQKSLSDNIEILRVQTETGKGEAFFDLMKSKFKDANLSLMKTTTIGATVGDSLKLNALISIALSMLGLMLYVAFRFEMGYGIGAVVSTVINVIMTIIIYLMFGHQISSATIASILMVVGYSINDTIIVFDRIREELKEGRSKSIKEIINYSITRTLSRTILTSASTFLAALALYVFGSGVVVDFALIFLIGVVVGTFSSIFIASPVFYLWSKKDRVPTSVGVSRHTA